MKPLFIYKIHATKPLFRFLAFLLLGTVVALLVFLFPKIFSVSYLTWYLQTGIFVALVVAALDVITEDLEDEYYLISADPVVYLYGCFMLASLLFFSTGTALYTAPADSLAQRKPSHSINPFLYIWDKLWTIVLAFCIMLGGFAWLLVYAPMNYFVQLVVAAPARNLLRGTSLRTVAIPRENALEVREWPARLDLPPTAVDISLSRKPLALSQSLLAVVLLAASLLI